MKKLVPLSLQRLRLPQQHLRLPCPLLVAAPKPAAPAAPAAAPAPAGAGDPVEAPLNGTVLSVNVKVGDTVKAGDVLCVLEAMKMENDIAAPKDGKITSVVAQKGSKC